MTNEIERMAEAIHASRPVTIDGRMLTWSGVVNSYPDRADIYREAARNRVRVEAAMSRLALEPKRPRPAP